MTVNANASLSVPTDRRPLRTRQAPWALPLASLLNEAGITPNQISLGSIGFAIAGAALYSPAPNVGTAPGACLLLGAAACIQLRLLCNMMDGLVAVECGQASKLGPIFNEVPDRIADALFLVGAGVATNTGTTGIILGFTAALAAVGTAYVRAFGASLTGEQNFSGPMAKQHRMFALTVATVGAAIEFALPDHHATSWSLVTGLSIILAGSIVTNYRRLAHLSQKLVNK